MKYMLLICGDEKLDLDPEVSAAMDAGARAWVEEMTERGVYRGGNRLQPVADATSVRVRDGEVLLSDGPFAETKEQVGGYDLIECADLDEAIAIAARHPVATIGTVEVRPFWRD